jgi:hypothetical protein
MIRRPVVAGHFYPQTEGALRKMLDGLIKTGPDKQEVTGVILPHAGYIYSGLVAGETVSKIEIKKTAVILGADHTGSGSPFSIMTKGKWLTPLGEVNIDAEIAGSILKSSRLLKDDDRGHINEHSIEVQLPFLQYFKADIKIVPIIMSGSGIEECRELGGDIAEGFKKVGRPAVFIASTDLTHYESRESAEEKDKLVIDSVLSLNEEKLFRVVNESGISMCGVAPACVLINVCKRLGAKRAGLVKYQTSGDITGDYSSVVGYAGMVIW